MKDESGDKVTSGSATASVYELQSDGTLRSYDFADHSFKTTALTTATLSLTHRTGNNGGTNTGLWTGVISTVTGFTRGNIYFVQISHASASPPQSEQQFQYGDSDGDLAADSSGKVSLTTSEHTAVATDVQTGLTAQGVTSVRAGRLDNLDAAVSTRSTYSGGAVASVTAPVTLDLTQAVPTSNTAQTVGDALNGARAQAFGKWTLVGTMLTLFAANGTTPVRTFTLNSATTPTSRT